jgi:hypothetical protein
MKKCTGYCHVFVSQNTKQRSQRLPGIVEQFLASKNAGEAVDDDDDDEH